MDLQELRAQLDGIDTQLTDLFCKRMEVCHGPAQEGAGDQGAGPHPGAGDSQPCVGKQAGKLVCTSGCSIPWCSTWPLLPGDSWTGDHDPGDSGGHRPGRQFPRKGSICQGVEELLPNGLRQAFSPCPTSCISQLRGGLSGCGEGAVRVQVLPIENSSNGSVSAVYDLMRRYGSIVRSIGCTST